MDFDDHSVSKMDASAQRVVDRAISYARQWQHALLTNEHVFLAFATTEWQLFSQIMRTVGVVPPDIARDMKDLLALLPKSEGREMRVAPATKLLFKLAFHHASRAGRRSIESVDLFSAIFEESQGAPVTIIRGHGVEPEVMISRINALMRELELRAERQRAGAKQTTEREAAAPTAPIATSKMFEEAERRWAAEEADKARAWPDPPRTFRRRLLDLMGFRARTKTN